MSISHLISWNRRVSERLQRVSRRPSRRGMQHSCPISMGTSMWLRVCSEPCSPRVQNRLRPNLLEQERCRLYALRYIRKRSHCSRSRQLLASDRPQKEDLFQNFALLPPLPSPSPP